MITNVEASLLFGSQNGGRAYHSYCPKHCHKSVASEPFPILAHAPTRTYDA